MMRTPKIHNLGPNSRESSPSQVIVVDTETRWHTTDETEHHTLRCWNAATSRRHGKNPSRPRYEQAEGEHAEALARWVDGQVKTTPVAWLYCHNLSFDLAVTRLTEQLGALGWTVTTHNLASDAPWAILRNGGRTLRLADSHSLLPVPLAQVGDAIGYRKPPLPTQDDSIEAWHIRCKADVEITMQGLTQLMDWWDEHKLGHWSVTGPRTGYNAMRHRCVKRPGYDPIGQQTGDGTRGIQHGDGHVVIDPDPDARAFERTTLYQGRREAFRVGVQPRGMYAEVDMTRAHLTAARTRKLPCRRGVAFDSLEVDSPYVMNDNMSIIADCEIETATARYPVRTRFGIIHPTGRFTTRLAGPEIAEARERGELKAIGKGYYYRLSWHMQPWANWAEEVLRNDDGQHPEVGRIAVKGWSRSVPGIWAARTSRVIEEGTSPVTGWHSEQAYDIDRKAPTTIVHMQGRMQVLLRDVEADDSFPAVLSFIQSHVRVAVGRMIDRIPDHRMLTCSTDSLLVDTTGYERGDTPWYRRPILADHARDDAARLIQYLSTAAEPFTMAIKGFAADVRILSPQHVRMDGGRKYSGIAGGAEETERDKFRFFTWPALGTQMAAGAPEGYVRQLRTVDMTRLTVPRWVYDCGCTEAPRAAIRDGRNLVLGPLAPFCQRHHDGQISSPQHPALMMA